MKTKIPELTFNKKNTFVDLDSETMAEMTAKHSENPNFIDLPSGFTDVKTSEQNKPVGVLTTWSEINVSLLKNNGGVFGNGGGTCIPDSLKTWVKMFKAGATRMRGRRFGEVCFHYWVENKGKVFDISGNILSIVNTDEYYKQLQVVGAEPAIYSGLFRSEVIMINCAKNIDYLRDGKDPVFNTKKILSLINDKLYDKLLDYYYEEWWKDPTQSEIITGTM
jgi:hypothetical protein